MAVFQIRDDDFGLCMIEAESPAEALMEYLRGHLRAADVPGAEVGWRHNGSSSFFAGGRHFRAVPRKEVAS